MLFCGVIEEMEAARKEYDVAALGELLIDFTPYGTSEQGNEVLEANQAPPAMFSQCFRNWVEKPLFSEKSVMTALVHYFEKQSPKSALTLPG